MKRILLPALIIFNFQFSIFNSIQAQDTITTVPPCTIDNWPYGYHLETNGLMGWSPERGEFGKKFNTKGMDIVGVAAFAVTRPEAYRTYFANNPNEHDNEYSQIYDTTFNECFEYFRLYKRHTDSSTLVQDGPPYNPTYHYQDTLEVIASAKMHVLDTNVIGYFDRHAYPQQSSAERYIPVRAAYFDSAVFVEGEFWVGHTLFNNEGLYDSNGVYYHHKTWTLDLPSIKNLAAWGTLDDILYRDTIIGYVIYYRNGVPHTLWYSNFLEMYLAVFPLYCKLPVYPSPLVMESPGGGTAEVAPVLSASDFVTLSPNPAVTEVRILSSTGIRRIQVYDISGRKVYESGADGPQASISVAGWPSGIYTVHVDTPLGLAVKKLEKVE